MPRLNFFGPCQDRYQTPPAALDPLFQYLPQAWTIWEPACGEKYLADRLEKKGFDVVATDILTGHNYLEWEPNHYDCVITNPPFSLKQQFLKTAYQRGRPFAFLLPISALETASRQHLYQKYGLELILFDRRIEFESPDRSKAHSYFASAWFTFGLNIGRQMTFAKISNVARTVISIDKRQLCLT